MPQEVMSILNESAFDVVLEQFPFYKCALSYCSPDIFTSLSLRIAILTLYSERIAEEIYVRIKGLPKSPESGHIRDIRNQHLNQLINISGVVTRRSGVFPQLKISWFDCMACSSVFGPFVQNQEREFRPNRCPQCQSKGGFQVNAERTIYRNYQKVTLQEAPGTVPPGRLPRHKDVALLGDLIDKVRPGQKIEVTGSCPSNSTPMFFSFLQQALNCFFWHF